MMLPDELDTMILNILQQQGNVSNAELARRIQLSPPATHARTRRLEKAGYIRQYAALLEHSLVGYDMLCFIQVGLALHQPEQVEAIQAAIRQMPEVLECYHLTGEYDYLLKVAIRNRADLERFVIERLTPVPGLARIHTSVVLSEVKFTTALPLGISDNSAG